MKPAPFSYFRVATLDEAFARLEEYGEEARILAGGQSLMPTLNMRLSAPDALIDINPIDELRGISVTDNHVRIGAMARHADIERSPEVAQHLPLIAEAIRFVAHPAIRNRGTFGGSIAHADPASELPACACALGARFEIASRGGRRTVAADEFFHGMFETSLGDGDILVAAEFPRAGGTSRSAFAELARRHGDYAIVGLAVQADVDRGTLGNPRLVFFGVGDRPMDARAAAAALAGGEVSDASIKAVQEALADDLDPPSDLVGSAEFKLHLARVLTERVLRQLVAGQ